MEYLSKRYLSVNYSITATMKVVSSDLTICEFLQPWQNFSSDEVLQLLDRFFNLEMLVIWETQYLNYSVHCYVPLSTVFFFLLCENTELFRFWFMRKCTVIMHPYLQSDQIMVWLVPWNKRRNQRMMRRTTSVKGMSFLYQRAFSTRRNDGR
jgi:hypothetical protein